MDGKHLLLVLLAVHRGVIGGIAIRRGGDTGRMDRAPCRTTHIDVLGSGKNGLRPLKFYAGQIGIDLQIVDIPVGKQIAPQRHLGRIVGVILVLQLQQRKAASGITVGDDPHDLRITALLLGEILDALAGGHGLRYSLGVGIDAVCGELLRVAVPVHIVEIGVDQLTDTAIDGKVGERLSTVIDVDFPKGFLLAAGGKCGGGQHTQHHDHHEEQCGQSFFHVHSSCVLK